MKNTVKNYLIRHLSGSKANQIESFDFADQSKLTFGRSQESDIKFDAEIDAVVSREHGKIVRDHSDFLSFTIIDNNSRNGIFVNKVRIIGSVSVFAGDEIQLGSNGPTFIFDLDPRPEANLAKTRLIEVLKPTTEMVTEQPNLAAPEKTGIGKETFERVITHERRKSHRTFWASLAAAVILFSAVGFVVWSKNKEDLSSVSLAGQKRADSILALNKNYTQAQLDSVLLAAKSGRNVAYDQIASANLDKVVKIYISWELYEVSENEELMHEYRPDANGVFHPLFLQTQSGIEPYLVSKRRSKAGLPVGSTGTGSGFVAAADGKILTNRHVGAAWKTRYSGFSWDSFPGYLVQGLKGGEPVTGKVPTVSEQDVFGWVPSETTMVNGRSAQVEGRNKYLKVVFANSSQPYEAHLVTTSQSHDVSLIKVDMNDLDPVTMNDNYSNIKSGQGIVVMGYPGGAPQQQVVRKSNDPFKPNPEVFSIASPVTSPGHIQQVVKSSSEFSSKESGFGDSYQLDLNATGGGNSGGPLFDDKGNVIGIFYAGGGNANQGIISFAIPIKYGLELLSVRRTD
ncbi:trypsin-like peptidase domain-containing protein [Dyadobacter psychrotolerans]|uniref:FHA domain-containing protein n=1 Tax=Dyadobacter psychrotolerans TaxID=2541721 RepID=A0A4V2Z4M7_9BACT|nr:trypsin-like peptidase domain-containing protein [Dyadobacter psychrotolerans]TDE17238.1 FHA domain-containing protein [Dyadobacter psychrotolerans]